MNDGISVAEACKTRALTDADYARLCTQEGNDMVLYFALGGAAVFIALVVIILWSRRQ